MRTPDQYSVFDATNPRTAPAELAHMAEHRPDLRPFVAGNPATPTETLDRLTRVGDVAIDAALRRREGGFPGGPAPVAPGGAPGVPTGFAAPVAGGQHHDGAAAGGAPDHPAPWQAPAPSAAGRAGGNPYASGPSPYAPRPEGPYGHPHGAPWAEPGQPRRNSHVVAWIVVAAVAVIAVVAVVAGFLLVRDGGISIPDGWTDGPSAYGDDPYLDQLWDDCAAGGAEACDDLYMESDFGTEYEEFGGSCGGRFPATGEWCTDLM